MATTTELFGWGRSHHAPARAISIHDARRVPPEISLSRGLGRAYGDAALPPLRTDSDAPPAVGRWPECDRVLAFDPTTGRLRAEAGLSLAALVELALPRGWFVPVSPGTAQVTLGGKVACDVHGKNHHHAGSFGAHVHSVRLVLPSGDAVELTPTSDPELFWATVGGMGLTGHIAEVEFDLVPVPSGWLLQETVSCATWESLCETLDASSDRPLTVAWVDLLASGRRAGRGLVHRARWADADEALRSTPPRLARPLSPPTIARVGRWTGRAFNALVFRAGTVRAGTRRVTPSQVFYPLDRIARWPRFYGRRGFAQYQCVLPAEHDPVSAAWELIETMRGAGATITLAVVKDFGPEGDGLLSFPRSGLTLALDFPIESREHAQRIHDRANERLIAHSGRIYLAKDAFTRREHFEAMERRRLDAWRAVRERVDPDRRLASALGERLLDPR